MNASRAAKLLCADCGAPMDEVDAVAVLASLQEHSIFECEWCGHITLLAKTSASAKSADWLHAASPRCQRGISRVSPLLVEALSA
jgi:DNA-directed RNA polymerase subunit RPC12/RpoP